MEGVWQLTGLIEAVQFVSHIVFQLLYNVFSTIVIFSVHTEDRLSNTASHSNWSSLNLTRISDGCLQGGRCLVRVRALPARVSALLLIPSGSTTAGSAPHARGVSPRHRRWSSSPSRIFSPPPGCLRACGCTGKAAHLWGHRRHGDSSPAAPPLAGPPSRPPLPPSLPNPTPPVDARGGRRLAMLGLVGLWACTPSPWSHL